MRSQSLLCSALLSWSQPAESRSCPPWPGSAPAIQYVKHAAPYRLSVSGRTLRRSLSQCGPRTSIPVTIPPRTPSPTHPSPRPVKRRAVSCLRGASEGEKGRMWQEEKKNRVPHFGHWWIPHLHILYVPQMQSDTAHGPQAQGSGPPLYEEACLPSSRAPLPQSLI